MTMTRVPIATLLRGVHRDPSPDVKLVERFLAGDEGAFTALVERHSSLVLAACRKVLGETADVDDVFQATFLALFRDARKIRNRAAIGPWLYGVAHRLAVRARTGAARRQKHERQSVRPEAIAAADLSWREACALLHAALDLLPDRYRLPLLLCYLEGKTRDEAAKELGRSLNTIKQPLEMGRNRLRSRLARRGLALSAGLLAAVHAPLRDTAPPPQEGPPIDARRSGARPTHVTPAQ